MTADLPVAAQCPCGSGRAYEACCRTLHAGARAPNPQALMRARYSAYALRLKLYLLATWHPNTRPLPDALELGDARTRWLGLKIVRCEMSGDDEGIVEFVARYRVGGDSAVRLHETSRFVCEGGNWLYIDGVIHEQTSRPARRATRR